ncbi:MAG TPA: hypothetical protein VN025_08695 [Candidatus Dormibacteraeota bacterium]|jgi:hypothetical protein|nr:hypothetical protein [Candidatus Dormibacteraeota bacterium]
MISFSTLVKIFKYLWSSVLLLMIARWIFVSTLGSWAPRSYSLAHPILYEDRSRTYYLSPVPGWIANHGVAIFIALGVVLVFGFLLDRIKPRSLE